MEYGKNILPADAAMYTLQNADIQAGILHMSAGGYLKYEFSEADIVTLSEYIRVALVAEPFTDRYKPKVRIHIHLESEEGGFYNNTLYPTEFTSGVYLQELQMKAGKYNKFTFEVFANETISFTMWELCPEAADEDIQTVIEGVEQSLPRLLYDYNTWPLIIEQDEQTIAIITCRLLDATDLQGHFLITYIASEQTVLTLRFYDNEAEELFAPLLYDLHAGRGSVGVPHAYLERLAGLHSFVVTAQVTSGTLSINTRGILFTIDGGYLAERELDVAMDMRDITIKQTNSMTQPEEIWIVGIDAGEALVRKRSYTIQNANVKFTPVLSLGKAIDAALEFDGDWVLRADADQYTIETEEDPWYFWVDAEHNLYCRHGEDESTLQLLDTNVISVKACKGYSSIMYPEQDQGLVVAYIKNNGLAYYNQYDYNSLTGGKDWNATPESLLPDNTWDSVTVTRLNDYRICFVLSNKDENVWLISTRTYVNQAATPELAYTDSSIAVEDQMATWLGYLDADFEYPVPNVVSADYNADTHTFKVVFDKVYTASELYSPVYSRIKFNKSDIVVKKVKWINEVDKSIVYITIEQQALAGIITLYFNAGKFNIMRVKQNDRYYPYAETITVQFDLTPPVIEQAENASAIKEFNLVYRGLATSTYNSEEYVENTHNINMHVMYKDVNRQYVDTDEVAASELECSVNIEYIQTGSEPI